MADERKDTNGLDRAVEGVLPIPGGAADERPHSVSREPPDLQDSPRPPTEEATAPSQLPKASTTNVAAEAEDLLVGKAHEPGHERNANRSVGDNAVKEVACHRRRLRVGFLSAFFFHHSVGLLMEGVMTRLDRRRFETTAIFLQPHPTSVSPMPPGEGSGDGTSAEDGGDSVGDDVYKAVRAGAEHVLDVPVNR